MASRRPQTTSFQATSTSAAFSASASFRKSTARAAPTPSSSTTTNIQAEWALCFGPGSDYYSPEDPRSILGVSPQHVKALLDAQTAELAKLRKETEDLKKHSSQERTQLQRQVNGFSATARAAARQASSKGKEALVLAKMTHEREVARVREAHAAEVAALHARVAALEEQQQQ